MANIRIGVIADVHGDITAVRNGIAALNDLSPDFTVANGDLNDRAHTPGSIERTMGAALEVATHPFYMHHGSHESVQEYEAASQALKSKHPSMVDAAQEGVVNVSGYDVVFLPGSDFVAGGEYQLVNHPDFKSGLYHTQEGIRGIVNMNDLRSVIGNAEHTILISHVPKKFHTEQGIDVAEYFNTPTGRVPGFIGVPQLKSQGVTDEQIKQMLIRENVGNADLEAILQELGVRHMISGHIHEAGQKANDFHGNYVEPGKNVPSLFLNPGPAPEGYVGLFELDTDNGLAKYELVPIK